MEAKPKKIKSLHIIGLVVLFAVLAAAAYFVIANNAGARTVAAGDNVSVYYTGKFQNGTVFDTNVGRQPFNFSVGSSQVIQGFGDAVIGMKLDQNKTVTVPPNQAYGVVNQSLIIKIPLADLGNRTVSVGSVFTQSTTGARGTVIAVNSTTATMDFNPPLAGDTLVFNIKVVVIHKK